MHKWDNYGNPNLTKRWQFVRPRFDADGQYSVNVYYLIGKNTIDEKIYKLIQDKLKVTSIVNSGIEIEDTNSDNNILIDFSNNPPGIYLLQIITDNNENHLIKVVKD